MDIFSLYYSDYFGNIFNIYTKGQNGRIFHKRIVFMVLHKWSSAAVNMAEELSRNNIPVVAYIVSDGNTEEETFGQISRTTVVSVPTDADLKEVL